MTQPFHRIPSTRGTLSSSVLHAGTTRIAGMAILTGGLIGLGLMVPLMLLWRGLAGTLPEPGGLWPALLTLPTLFAAGWSAAALSGATRRRVAALHGVGVWALLLVTIAASAIFAPGAVDRAIPGLSALTPAAGGDLVLGTLALAGLCAAALGASLGMDDS